LPEGLSTAVQYIFAMLPRKLNIYFSVSCVSVAYSSPAEWVAIKGGLGVL